MNICRRLLQISGFGIGLVCGRVDAEPVTVRFPEGSVHGYLVLRTLEGKVLASGNLIQTVHGDRLTARLTYRFRDGSIDDETAVFSQKGAFRLITDHRIQKGPAFSTPVEMTIDAAAGQVTVRYAEKDQEKVETSHMDLPDDLSNGILLNIVKNISPKADKTELSYLAATPKPRLIRLTIRPDGEEGFRSAGAVEKANRFVIHADLGGLAGLIAPVIGKEPPDARVWVGVGGVPAYIKSEAPLFLGGALVRTELVSPVWGR